MAKTASDTPGEDPCRSDKSKPTGMLGRIGVKDAPPMVSEDDQDEEDV